MENHVATYECEWTAVVNDPEKRKKFKHFINTDDRDSTIEFVDERGQKAPIPW